MPRFRKGLIVFGILGALLGQVPLDCRADNIYNIVIGKQEEKAKSRWSLADWLDTRDRMRVQDIWLAMHTSTPFEFFLDGNYQFNQVSGGNAFNGFSGSVGAYYSLWGLEGKYDSLIDKHTTYTLNLRVVGFHDQATHMAFQLGLRETSDVNNISYRNALLGIRLSLYIFRVFGFRTVFQYYFPSTTNSTGVSFSGNRIEVGPFLEFGFVRFYSNYFSKSETNYTMTGLEVGLRTYF